MGGKDSLEEQKLGMTRKEFLKKSSAAVLGVGLMGVKPVRAGRSERDGKPLQKIALGRTGLSVTRIAFGASRTMESSLVRAALDAGINFLDSGRSYFRGKNEVMLGGVIKGIRNRVVIQSKLKFGISEKEEASPSAEVVQRALRNMADSLEASLKAYGSDYIDIMLIHGAVSPTLSHHDEVKAFFEAAKKAGKIRAHGFSSHANQIAMLREANRQQFFDIVMVPYNHKGSFVHMNSGSFSEWDQPALEKELDRAMRNKMGVIAMKTCSGGPYAPRGQGEPSYAKALEWLLEGGKVHAGAVAMANFDQLEENLKAAYGAGPQ